MIQYGKWQSVRMRWSSINSYTLLSNDSNLTVSHHKTAQNNIYFKEVAGVF